MKPTINAEVFSRLASHKESGLFRRVEIDAITYMAASPFHQNLLPLIVAKPMSYPKRFRDELGGSYETMHECVRTWLEAFRRNPIELLKLQTVAVKYMQKRPRMKGVIRAFRNYEVGPYQAGKLSGTDARDALKERRRLDAKMAEYESLK